MIACPELFVDLLCGSNQSPIFPLVTQAEEKRPSCFLVEISMRLVSDDWMYLKLKNDAIGQIRN